MSKSNDKLQRESVITITLIAVFCAIFAVLELVPIHLVEDGVQNAWIVRILSNSAAIGALLILIKTLKIKPFMRVEHWLFLLPAFAVALANLPLISYLNGNMSLVRDGTADFILFIVYCISVGVLEELVFRGVLFPALAGSFTQDKKGLIKAFVLSSVLFGAAHLTNLFRGANVGATFLQVLYTTLTGGLFCFVFIQTKNVLCSAAVHALYNMCGLIFETPARLGLGSGVVFDAPTIIVMAVIDVCVCVVVLYSLRKYPIEEQKAFYKRLNIS